MRKKFIEFDGQLINVKEIVFVGKVTGINARKIGTVVLMK